MTFLFKKSGFCKPALFVALALLFFIISPLSSWAGCPPGTVQQKVYNKEGGYGFRCVSRVPGQRGQVCQSPTTMCKVKISNFWVDKCVDTKSDNNNCGKCGNSCGNNQLCKGGVCTDCPFGWKVCNGVCTNVISNQNNCGGCGVNCGQNVPCVNGQCCPSGEGMLNCGGQCMDTYSDCNNCGGCGTVCKKDTICENGQCVPADPTDPQAQPYLCGKESRGSASGGNGLVWSSPGYWTNLSSDASNCGALGHSCGPPNGICCNGVCKYKLTDYQNCGGCGIVCSKGQNACQGGVCSGGSVGGNDCGGCGGLLELCCNGKCVSEGGTSDRSNCGGCGIQCPSGGLVCTYGQCTRN